jgi:hypothetical protein
MEPVFAIEILCPEDTVEAIDAVPLSITYSYYSKDVPT